MKILILAAAIAGTSATARAQASWPVIYKDASVSVALDTAAAQKNDDGSFVARTRWDYTRLHALESKRPYMAMTQEALVKCTPVRIKRLSESFYSAKGSVVREGSPPNPKDVPYMTWDRVKTGSSASKAFSSACALLKKRNRA